MTIVCDGRSRAMRRIFLLITGLTLLLFSGCSRLSGEQVVRPIPTELLPTRIAQTLEAKGVNIQTPGEEAGATSLIETAAPSASAISPLATASQTNTPSSPNQPSPTSSPSMLTQTQETAPTETPLDAAATAPMAVTSIPGEATDTPAPYIPDSKIQIYWIGELSKVTAPIQVIARLTSQTGEIARVELYGEDGRLLARQVKTFYTIPWQVAGIDIELDFEIRASAELGRLVISVEDIYGRLVDVNSVNLVLLSSGETVLNPASALWQRIYIKEPTHKTLIQGGVLTVAGLARPDSDQFLRISIIDESGRIVGQRLTGVGPSAPGGYGAFTVEVPYTVAELTPVLVTVSEDGGTLSELSHLASIQVLLSP